MQNPFNLFGGIFVFYPLIKRVRKVQADRRRIMYADAFYSLPPLPVTHFLTDTTENAALAGVTPRSFHHRHKTAMHLGY